MIHDNLTQPGVDLLKKRPFVLHLLHDNRKGVQIREKDHPDLLFELTHAFPFPASGFSESKITAWEVNSRVRSTCPSTGSAPFTVGL